MGLSSFLDYVRTTLFDIKKRFDMEKYYKTQKDPWSRSHSLLEVKTAMGLLKDMGGEGGGSNRCLDIGTGEGYFAEAASPICGHILGIDISREAINKARKRLIGFKNIEFMRANVRNFKPKNKFDLIICGDVLYYLGDMLLPEEFSKLVAKISDWLESGGRLLLTHGALPSRSEDWFWNTYVKQFERNSLAVEKKDEFNQDNITWLHVVLRKL